MPIELRSPQRLLYALVGLSIILVAVVYLPIIHAGFVWDDTVDFHDMAWLRQGDDWRRLIFKGFSNWTVYFRPLSLMLLTLEVRFFDAAPGPMHAASLGIHLINTALVASLSANFVQKYQGKKQAYIPAGCSLLYGIHPLLIEPVAWIASQFDLFATMLMLIGLLANIRIRRTGVRVMAVSGAFFLAACAKESAVSFPLLLVIFDWLRIRSNEDDHRRSSIVEMVCQKWPMYLAVFFTGLAYLALRFWAIGEMVNPFAKPLLSAFGHVQEVCFLYLRYLLMLIIPTLGMSPVHPVDLLDFEKISTLSLLVDFVAISIAVTALVLVIRRTSGFVIGSILLAVTACLLPVLHIATTGFDSSLYHERYGITALAITCSLLPLVRIRFFSCGKRRGVAFALIAVSAIAWLVFATTAIRSTLPSWSSDVKLWRWALVVYPNSVDAKDGLLSAYIDQRDYVKANNLIEQLFKENVQCTNCMLNAAILAVKQNDPKRAAAALHSIRDSSELASSKQMFRSYLLTTAQMLILEGKLIEAEQILIADIKMDLLDPEPQITLAMNLGLQGKKTKAREVGVSGIALVAADEREQRRSELEKFISSADDVTKPSR